MICETSRHDKQQIIDALQSEDAEIPNDPATESLDPNVGGSFALRKPGFSYTTTEWMILLLGMVTAFIVSMVVIKFLMGYIKKHDFKVFGWYRIVLGIAVLGYFAFI